MKFTLSASYRIGTFFVLIVFVTFSVQAQQDHIEKRCIGGKWVFSPGIDVPSNAKGTENWCSEAMKVQTINHEKDDRSLKEIEELLCKNESDFEECNSDQHMQNTSTAYLIVRSHAIASLPVHGINFSQYKIKVLIVGDISEQIEQWIRNNNYTEFFHLTGTKVVRHKRAVTDTNLQNNYQVTVLLYKTAIFGEFRMPLELGQFQTNDLLYFILNGNYNQCKLINPGGVTFDLLKNEQPNKVALKKDVITVPIIDQPQYKYQEWTVIASGWNYNITALILRKKTTITKYGNQPTDTIHPDDEKNKHYRRRTIDKEDEDWRPMFADENGKFSSAFNNLNDVPQRNVPMPNFKELLRPQQIILNTEVNPKSILYSMPGQIVTIIYDVSHNGPEILVLYFHCNYQHGPCNVEPKWTTLHPFKILPVAVTVNAEGSEGSSGIVALSAQGFEMWTKKTYLNIGKPVGDNGKPDVDYQFNGNCDNADKGYNCDSKQWSVDVTVKDEGSGLLKVWSDPPGFLLTSEFISGTKDKVYGRFSSSCCSTKVDISAMDLAGNTRTQTLDIQHQTLSFLEWMVIALGVILLLILLAIIIYCILKWRQKRKERQLFNN